MTLQLIGTNHVRPIMGTRRSDGGSELRATYRRDQPFGYKAYVTCLDIVNFLKASNANSNAELTILQPLQNFRFLNMSKIIGFVRDSLSLSSLSEELKMLYSPLTLAIFLFVFLLIKMIQYIKFNKRLPPGPSGYPFLGMLPKITKEFHLQLFDYSKSFGKIFSLKMGNQLIVVLSDHKMIKAAFGKSEFAARPKTEFGNILGGYGEIKYFLKFSFSLKHL